MSFTLPGGRATEALRVAVVADDPLARDALAHLLGGHDDLEITPSTAEADVILWDAGVDGDAIPRRLRDAATASVALVPDAVAAAEALALGLGVVARDADAGRIASALLAASQGLVVVDATFADAVVDHARDQPDLAEPLTPRERQVLDLLADGLSNRAVAERLGISEHTAKFHVNGILAKLGAATRTEAVVLAARSGLLML